MKTPTPEEINATNAEFWKVEGKKFRRRIKEYPEELQDAAEHATNLLREGLGNHPKFLAETSLEAAMAKAEERADRLLRRRQSRYAKKPRPGKRSTLKSVTIAAMRKARTDGQTLKGFIESAQDGNVEIEPAGLPGVERFTVTVYPDAGEEEPIKRNVVAPSTLEEWWAKAGKPATTD